MTRTCSLLGLVKHLAGVEAGYFGDVFERAFAPRWRRRSSRSCWTTVPPFRGAPGQRLRHRG
ncbi:MAG: DUF664 domain-containing protein [Homoserinimonas sp.]